MKLFACLLLSVALSNVSPAQVPMSTRMAEGTKAWAAGVKNFFVPSAGRYSGLQNVIAGLTIAGMACMGLNGCSVKYKEEQRPQIELLQNVGKWGGGIATAFMLASTVYIRQEEWHHSYDRARKYRFFRTDTKPLYILIPLSIFAASHLWDASTLYVQPDGSIQAATPEPRDTLVVSDDIDLRNYFREHLTPSTYRHVFSNPAYEDGFVAVPTNAELFIDKEDPLAGLVSSLEQADTVYYGRMTEPAVFALDALKHKGESKIQLLVEEHTLSVVPTD